MTTVHGVDEPVALTPPDTPASYQSSPLPSPTHEGDDAAARRTVARAVRIGAWIWPSYALLDVYMCFVVKPDAPFALFIFYRVVIELAFFAVYRASRTMELKRLVFFQTLTYVAPAVTISLMAVHIDGI